MNAHPTAARTPRFHPLVIADIRRETVDTVSIAFDVPPDLAAAYRFEPGQYLTLRATIDGAEIRRSYSICSGPLENELRIAVKKVEDGLFSTHVHQALTPGETIDVMTPTGRFGATVGEGGNGRVHVAFAAGSGITPILSLMKGALTREPDSRFCLFYGSRSVDEVIFRRELEDLKDRYLGRLSVFHVLSREAQDIAILNGHLDGEKVRRLMTSMVPAHSVDVVYVCGPTAMLDDLHATLQDIGIAPERIHIERFVSADGGVARARRPVVADGPAAHTIAVVVDGKSRVVPAADGETVLDAALRAGLDLPFACKGGMCSTCRARVTDGAAVMDVNYSLEPWELAKGFVLTCQAKPTTPTLTVDFDAM